HRFQLLRILKWAGTLTCLLILAAYVTTAWFSFELSHPHLMLFIESGKLTALYRLPPYGWGPAFDVSPTTHTADLCWGLSCSEAPHSFALSLGEFRRWTDDNGYTGEVDLPLWFLFVVGLAPTLLLWRLDRRVPPDHCRKCRYSLTGNTTGRCPECGAT